MSSRSSWFGSAATGWNAERLVGANVVRQGRGETEGETKGTERGGAVEATNCKRGERKSKGEAA